MGKQAGKESLGSGGVVNGNVLEIAELDFSRLSQEEIAELDFSGLSQEELAVVISKARERSRVLKDQISTAKALINELPTMVSEREALKRLAKKLGGSRIRAVYDSISSGDDPSAASSTAPNRGETGGSGISRITKVVGVVAGAGAVAVGTWVVQGDNPFRGDGDHVSAAGGAAPVAYHTEIGMCNHGEGSVQAAKTFRENGHTDNIVVEGAAHLDLTNKKTGDTYKFDNETGDLTPVSSVKTLLQPGICVGVDEKAIDAAMETGELALDRGNVSATYVVNPEASTAALGFSDGTTVTDGLGGELPDEHQATLQQYANSVAEENVGVDVVAEQATLGWYNGLTGAQLEAALTDVAKEWAKGEGIDAIEVIFDGRRDDSKAVPLAPSSVEVDGIAPTGDVSSLTMEPETKEAVSDETDRAGNAGDSKGATSA